MSNRYLGSDEWSSDETSHRHAAGPLRVAAQPIIWFLRVLRFMGFAVLSVLEPLIRWLLWMFAVLMIVGALLLRLVGPPDFPFWGMLAMGAASATLLAIYYLIMRWMTPR